MKKRNIYNLKLTAIVLGLLIVGKVIGVLFTEAPTRRLAELAGIEMEAQDDSSGEPKMSGLEVLEMILQRKGPKETRVGGVPNSKGYVETDREACIYSYVQCPEDHYDDKQWTGDWPAIEAGGQTFWGFGCGLCCLTNMVSTLTQEKCTPDQMYRWAQEYTDYYPESGTGALTWEQMQYMCRYFGLSASIREKPEEYEDFQNDIAKSDTMVVLVCSANDDTLWHTNGHYVNIWEYDPETDTVFVTDSSGKKNRVRVQLEDVYRALKTASTAQYLAVRRK